AIYIIHNEPLQSSIVTLSYVVHSKNDQFHKTSYSILIPTLDDIEGTNPRLSILDQLDLFLCQQKVECYLAVQHGSKIRTVKENHPLVVAPSHTLKAVS